MDIKESLLTYKGNHPYLSILKKIVIDGGDLNAAQEMFAKKLLTTHAVKKADRTLLPLPTIIDFQINWEKEIYLAKSPYNFQKLGINWLMNKKKCILGDEMGCIDGEALISVNRSGSSFKIKFKDLYEKFNGLKGKWELNTTTYASCQINNQLYKRKILGVYYRGKKKVLKLTLEDGKTLKTTSDHLFLKTDFLWKPLSVLNPGDVILTNGTDICLNCNTKENLIKYPYSKFLGYCKPCMYRTLRTNKHKSTQASDFVLKSKYIYVKGFIRFHPHFTSGGIYKHRLIYEAQLNNYTYEEWLNIIKYNKFTKDHVFLAPNQIIHHIDGNISNNSLTNLELVSNKEHATIHKDRSRIKKTIPKSLKIEKIEDENEVIDVYDMTVEESHNYVANGIIVHNCGKSLEAIIACVEAKFKKILIICPNTLKLNWKKEIECFDDQLISIIDKTYNPNAKWIIVNYDKISKLEKELKKIKFDILIGDEAHYVKSGRKAKRAACFARIATKIPRTWLLTGTPIANKPIDFYQLLKICRHELGQSKEIFGQKYCGGVLTQWGWDYNGASNLKDLYFRIQDVMLRRTKKQVLDLPEKQLVPIYLELDSKRMKAYEKAVADKYQEIYDNVDNEESKHYGKSLEHGQAFIEMAAYRMFTAIEKTIDGTLQDLIENIIESGQKVVIFTNFTSVIDNIKNMFEDNCLILDGRVSLEQRQINIDKFQNGKEQVCACNYKVGSVGTTLTKAAYAIMNDFPWDPATLKQAEDRIHRIGQEQKTTIYFPIYSSTIDEAMFNVLGGKIKNVHEAIDGDKDLVKFEYSGSVVNAVYKIINKQKKR